MLFIRINSLFLLIKKSVKRLNQKIMKDQIISYLWNQYNIQEESFSFWIEESEINHKAFMFPYWFFGILRYIRFDFFWNLYKWISLILTSKY